MCSAQALNPFHHAVCVCVSAPARSALFLFPFSHASTYPLMLDVQVYVCLYDVAHSACIYICLHQMHVQGGAQCTNQAHPWCVCLVVCVCVHVYYFYVSMCARCFMGWCVRCLATVYVLSVVCTYVRGDLIACIR